VIRRTRVGDNALFERLVKHLGEFLNTDVSHLKPESRLATAVAGLDSLMMFELMLYFEDVFGITVDDKAVEHLDTLRDLEGYVRSRLPGDTAAV
jgi:acyl carrier protein